MSRSHQKELHVAMAPMVPRLDDGGAAPQWLAVPGGHRHPGRPASGEAAQVSAHAAAPPVPAAGHQPAAEPERGAPEAPAIAAVPGGEAPRNPGQANGTAEARPSKEVSRE